MKALNLEFDDFTKDEYGTWSQVCEGHLTEIRDSSSKEIEKQIEEWGGFGFCGVKGCSNEAEHYIDFKVARHFRS